MAKNKALETKALKAETKSAGMRMLLEGGYEVAEVAAIFDAPYGFVYGVASRAGLINATPRTAKAKAPAKKATATKPATAAKAAPRTKASAKTSKPKAKAKA